MCYTAAMRFLYTIFLVSIFIQASFAQAVDMPFPDVPSDYVYTNDIAKLAADGILTGNADGNFYPNRIVNRAEIVKILYMAAGKKPDTPSAKCFTDIDVLAWYAPYICDAKRLGYIHGYSDGTFKPSQSVNRAEALKMLFTILELPIVHTMTSMPDLPDIDANAWYMPYVRSAYEHTLLPLYGQPGPGFGPEKLVTRGEMAAYVHYCVYVIKDHLSQQNTWSASASSVSSTTVQSVSSSASSFNPVPLNTSWQQSGNFTSTKPVTYSFTVNATETIHIEVVQDVHAQAAAHCTLFKFEPNGFSYELYYGHEQDRSCTIVATLLPGTYQFQMVPTIADAAYSAAIRTATGDGNDNFAQATALRSTVLGQTLPANNTHNWYSFELKVPTRQMITLADDSVVQCDIYGLENVDFDGPNKPVCNVPMLYPAGSYIVGVRRLHTPLEQSVRYSISKAAVVK
jgi:hypothetical protein